jgi:small glutamine-rich tetratricopeptide repeat-containing protein alpha
VQQLTAQLSMSKQQRGGGGGGAVRPPSSPLAAAALSPRRSAGVEALRGQGRAAVRTGRYTDAVEAYSEAIALAPRDTALRLVRSQTYIKLKNFAAALDDATICTNLNPQLWKGWNCVAQAHMQLMSFGPAMHAFKKGLDLQPRNPDLAKGYSRAAAMQTALASKPKPALPAAATAAVRGVALLNAPPTPWPPPAGQR